VALGARNATSLELQNQRPHRSLNLDIHFSELEKMERALIEGLNTPEEVRGSESVFTRSV
jgi:hypothetical protein